jgi:diaminohydroxyphosphoribosylaminopyrimidine deaminase/5-amino-6-(5-phosphoribosylamino)uracil reductase
VFDGAAPTMVATTDRAPEQRLRAWSDAGADVVVIDRDDEGRVSLCALVEHLGKRDVQGVLLEGGPSLAWSAVREHVVDRVVAYVAPLLIGGAAAPTALDGAGFVSITSALRLGRLDVSPMDDDLKVVADVHGHR